FLMGYPVVWQNPVWIVFVLVQMHLYTGLFITAHDAMHGTVSGNKKTNTIIGQLALMLYAALPYHSILPKHRLHHAHVATAADPDYHEGNFITWYLRFILQYLSWWQFIIPAIVFNVLHYVLHIPQTNLILFWILPSVLSTVQLFYVGTYLPHKNPEQLHNPHKSRSQRKNHLWGFLSCYFFGYHYEHHDQPHLPWWQLWKTK
ncbi:MAG: fatty acid desaturase, partial [Bacteroidia bacterium]|nr:fatty acid desaturase [Bacteroidia bacterium]